MKFLEPIFGGDDLEEANEADKYFSLTKKEKKNKERPTLSKKDVLEIQRKYKIRTRIFFILLGLLGTAGGSYFLSNGGKKSQSSLIKPVSLERQIKEDFSPSLPLISSEQKKAFEKSGFPEHYHDFYMVGQKLGLTQVYKRDDRSIHIAYLHAIKKSDKQILFGSTTIKIVEALIPVLEKLAKKYPIVFILEGTNTFEEILPKEEAGEFFLPKQFRNMKADWKFAGVDYRFSEFGNDYYRLVSEVQKIFYDKDENPNGLVEIYFGPEGSIYNSADIIKNQTTHNIWRIKRKPTEKDDQIMFTFAKLFRQIENDIGQKTKKLISSFIKQGYFPVVLYGGAHIGEVSKSYIIAAKERMMLHILAGKKEDEYLNAILKRNPDSKSQKIPESFKPFLKCLDEDGNFKPPY